MKLRNSELILNPDGSIYHLHLRPEQVAPLIFLVGDQDRVPKVSRYFDAVEFKVRKREFVTHTGRIGNTRVSVMSTGIGTDNIDIVLNEVDALFNIDLETRQVRPKHTAVRFIRLGTAGSLHPEVPVDSIVVSSAGLGLDGLLHFYNAAGLTAHPAIEALRAHVGPAWDFPVRPYFSEADPALIRQLGGLGPNGITASNAGFYGPQGRQLRAPVALPQYLDLLQGFHYNGMPLINLEMETSAIYGLSSLLGHQALSLSAILANRPTGAFSKDPARAVKRLIEAALGKI
jgi:uridine phosphorylase